MSKIDSVLDGVGITTDVVDGVTGLRDGAQDPVGFWSVLSSGSLWIWLTPLLILSAALNLYHNHLKSKIHQNLLPEWIWRIKSIGFFGSLDLKDKLNPEGQRFLRRYHIFAFANIVIVGAIALIFVA